MTRLQRLYVHNLETPPPLLSNIHLPPPGVCMSFMDAELRLTARDSGIVHCSSFLRSQLSSEDSGTAQSRPIQSRQFSPRQFSPRHFSPTTIQSQTDQSQDISVPKYSVQKFSVPDSSVLKHFSPANSVPN